MDRKRWTVLGAVAAAVVVVFLVAPDDGRFARTPTMVLLGVLAVLWHLWGADRPVSAGRVEPTVAEPSLPMHDAPAPPSPVPPAPVHEMTAPAGPVVPAPAPDTAPVAASDPAPSADLGSRTRPGFFDLTPHEEPDSEDDLAGLPDPPLNWPPPGVQVPRVFQVASDEPPELAGSSQPAGEEPRRMVGEPASVRTRTPQPESEVIDLRGATAAPAPAADAPADPWLAFAASMLARRD